MFKNENILFRQGEANELAIILHPIGYYLTAKTKELGQKPKYSGQVFAKSKQQEHEKKLK